MINYPGFITGINYWPAHKAMSWWKQFDPDEIQSDFKKMAQFNLRLVRIFLTWEDFQPQPDSISLQALDNLKLTADIAQTNQLGLMPTFFCGHMSGVNWMPEWMLTDNKISGRFPVGSNNCLSYRQIRNFYSEAEVIAAQAWQIEKVGRALRGHPAIQAYDLGNEASNCVLPPDRSCARHWLEVMTARLKQSSGNLPVTLGMHAEDLEENRRLWPQDAALYCDFLSMHGYPFYLSWVEHLNETEILPFLVLITMWLGQKPVLLQEFGIPSLPANASALPAPELARLKCPIWNELEALTFYQSTFDRLRQIPVMGALGWCFSDYSPDLWDTPPLAQNPHERFFGLFSCEGTPKAAVMAFKEYNSSSGPIPQQLEKEHPWLNYIDREDFYSDPGNKLRFLYQKYKSVLSN